MGRLSLPDDLRRRSALRRFMMLVGISAFTLTNWPTAALFLTLSTGIAYGSYRPAIPLAVVFGALVWIRTLGL